MYRKLTPEAMQSGEQQEEEEDKKTNSFCEEMSMWVVYLSSSV